MKKQHNILGILAFVFALLFVFGVVYAIIGKEPAHPEDTAHTETKTETTLDNESVPEEYTESH